MANNLLDEIDASKPAPNPQGLSGELLDLRRRWEQNNGGWDENTTQEREAEMLKNPDVIVWSQFLAGLSWTKETPEKLSKLYELMRTEGAITQEHYGFLQKNKSNLSASEQVREGKIMSAWLRQHRSKKAQSQRPMSAMVCAELPQSEVEYRESQEIMNA